MLPGQAPAPTIVRPLLIVAAAVLVLGAMRIGAAIINPVLLALVITLICNPLYTWLQRRGVPTWLALLLMGSGFAILAILIGSFIGISVGRISSRLVTYQTLLAEQELRLRAWLAGYGLVPGDLQFFGLLNSGALTRLLGAMLSAIGNLLGNSLLVTMLVLFFLVEMPSFRQRLEAGLGRQHPLLQRLTTFGGSMVRYFAIRTYINFLVAAGATLALLLLRVDFALFWGLLIFVFSYIPYIGIPLASLPAVLLALAEHGPGRAIALAAAITLINTLVENLIAPSLIGRELSISPAVVFVSFFFWTWLLGPPGTFLSMPITVLLIFVLDSYADTRWLARLMGSASLPAPPPAGAPTPAAPPISEGQG